jgi:HEAT repeat protein
MFPKAPVQAPIRWALALASLSALAGCSANQSPSAALAEGLGFGPSREPEKVAADAFNTNDPDKRRRSVAVIASGPAGDADPYVRMYRTLLTDPDPTVQAACARALGMHGKVEDALRLANLLDHENTFVRWEAAKALQRLHNPETADDLIDAVQEDSDADVRMAAADALGQYPQPAVFDALIGALRDTNYGVVQQARDALRTLTGHNGPANATVWLDWAENHRGQLFRNRETYTYQPYDEPPTWLDKAWFWREAESPEPRPPRGLEVAEREGDAPAKEASSG